MYRFEEVLLIIKKLSLGRPRDSYKDKYPVVSLSFPIDKLAKLKSGYYEEIESLLDDYLFLSQEESQTSPRYEKLREMMEIYLQIKRRNEASISNIIETQFARAKRRRCKK